MLCLLKSINDDSFNLLFPTQDIVELYYFKIYINK